MWGSPSRGNIPPPPRGFSLDEPEDDRRDPWDILRAEGFVATNGFRTEADVERIRNQGYTPARNGAHNRGDGVDLDHPKLSRQQQVQRLKELFGDWEGFSVLDEGHHRHLGLPGWGAAPGTPGTPNFGLPEPPPGFKLTQRGSLADGNYQDAPPQTPQRQTPSSQPARAPRPSNLAPLVESPSAGVAFNDELPETITQRLTPDQLANWYALARDPKSTPDQLRSVMKGYGFDLGNADEIVSARNNGLGVNTNPTYKPREIPKNRDGATGAAVRGFGDPFNFLDEMGSVVDVLGGTKGRENIWNSDRGFFDLIGRNIDENRAILAADERDHFEARFGGQLASSLLIPFGAGARGAAGVAKIGAIEGGLAGFGAGEGNPLQRLPNAAVGTALGTTGGYALGRVIDDVGPLVTNRMGRRRESEITRVAREAAYESAPVVNDGMQQVPPTPAARTQYQVGTGRDSLQGEATFRGQNDVPLESPVGYSLSEPVRTGRLPEAPLAMGPHAPSGASAMPAEFDNPTLTGPAPRQRDYIDLGNVPPPPRGFVMDDMLGGVRPMSERLSAEDVARLGRDIDPRDVTPIPPNTVASLDEFNQANPGTLREMEAPRLGRRPAKPEGILAHLKARVQADTSAKGVPVRIDAEDAISNGVPAEYIYLNPNEADKAKLRLRNPSIFGTRYGSMSSTQQQLRPLDQFDLDPPEWGFDANIAAGRLEPEELGDLLRRDFEGDESALRRGPAYDDWKGYQDRSEARAEFEGRFPDDPPVEQIGEEISFDDLDALTPPGSAYEDGPKITGRIGNINLAHLENPADVSRLIQHVQNRVGGFDPAMRGKITHEMTRKLADDLGLKPADILKRRQGQALNAEQLYAIGTIAQKSREVVTKLAQKAVGGSDEDMARFRNAWVRHVAIEEQVASATAEAGRALSQFRMLRRGNDASGAAVRAYLHGAGGRETVEDAAQRIVDLMEDPAKQSRFMRKAVTARTRDKVAEYWRASLLWGPRTHVVNAVSNTLTTLYTLPEQALTAGIGTVLKTEDRALFREIGARAAGMIEGARDGLRLAKQAWLTGEPSDQASKLEAAHYRAISGKKGEFIRLPFRALMASDEFFKAINRQAAINAMAYPKAVKRAGPVEDRLQRYAELRADPDEEIRDYGDQQARYLTFQTPLGKAGRGIQQAINDVPVLPLIVPYFRTPVNLLKFAGERSVFAPIMREFREAYAAGGNARNEAIAKMTMGSGLSAWAVAATLDGRISGGGPSDHRERQSLLNSGWQPYSVKIGDEWISYQRFEPVGLLIGAAADFAEVGQNATNRELEELALGLTLATAKNITSKTWLSGLSDFFDVLSDPERHGPRWARRMVGTAIVPSGIAHAAGATDPYMREVSTVLDAIRNRVPGLSRDLTARRNVWGEEVKRGSGAGQGAAGAAYNFISPAYTTSIDKSPLMQEVARLRAPLPMPQRSITSGGVKHKLTPEQHSYYVQLSGKPARAFLDGYIQTQEWRAMSDEDRREFLKETLEDFRKEARTELKRMFPELNTAKGAPPPPGFAVAE